MHNASLGMPLLPRVSVCHLLLHPSQYSTVHSNYKKALAAYEECLALDAQRASTYAAIGFTQLLLGRLDEAIDNLHKVLCSSHS